MNFKVLYCHSHESGNPFFAYISTVDTRFRGYDIQLFTVFRNFSN